MLHRLKSRGMTDTDLVILIALLAGATLLVWPRFSRCHCGGTPLMACKSNLKNIGTACEMYSTDNAGLYPRYAERLTPNYLKSIPTCASTGTDTYSAGFRSAAHPDTYTFFCQGLNHAASGEPSPNYPQYNSTQGLVT